jgi:hypothetical protein
LIIKGVRLLNDNDLMNVQETASKLVSPVYLKFNYGSADTEYAALMAGLAAQITGVSANKIEYSEWNSPLAPNKPSICISNDTGKEIFYLAAPEGMELAPFLKAVSWLGGASELPKSPSIAALAAISDQMHVNVMIASVCPHCPATVTAAVAVALSGNSITLAVIDALEFQEFAEKYRVKSTPMLVVNDGFTAIGNLSPQDLASRIVEISREDSLTLILSSMVKNGRAEDAGDLLRRGNPEAILPIYTSNEFSARIGALVAMEEALESDPRCLDPLVDELCKLLFQDETPLRGDTAELLGKIGHPSAIPFLERAASDEDEDVRGAVEEALERLRPTLI